jgi:peptidoglycan LD-endopeptidase CwlK
MAIKLAEKTPTLQSLLDRADKKLVNVHPTVREKAIELIKRAYAQGINVLITQGFRSIAEQNELYAQGRTKPGKIVTNAKGGYSYHNFGLAFDIVIQNADGSLCWNTGDKRWQTVGAIDKSLGLEWGGDWHSFPDYPHFQLTFGLSLADLRSGKRPPQPTPKMEVDAEMSVREVNEYKLTETDRKVIDELKRLGITDGKNPTRPVNQLYVWHVVHAALKAIKDGKVK